MSLNTFISKLVYDVKFDSFSRELVMLCRSLPFKALKVKEMKMAWTLLSPPEELSQAGLKNEGMNT